MIRLNAYQPKHSFNPRKVQKMTATKKFGIKDVLYGFVFLLITATVINHFDVRIGPKGAFAPVVHAQMNGFITTPQIITVNESDKRVGKLKAFLEQMQSPLAPYAQTIITESDNNAIDWTKIVAISGMESHYCTQMPANSHNCWGLGGDNFMHFNSWEDGIKYMAHLLGNQYKTDELEGIKTRYCPSWDGCNPAWAQIVTDKSNEILQTEGK